jgi:hypothetical protein
MKKYILSIVLLFVFNFAFSQYSIAPPANSSGFNVESGSKLQSPLVLDGETFDVFETVKGSKYVKLTSKKGNIYPYWIGEPNGDTFQNKEVRASKSGNLFTLRVNKNHLGRISIRKTTLIKE